MNRLAEIVGSKIRAEVFRLLFTGREQELHIREIQRRTGFNDRAIRQELVKLARLDLVAPRRDGNRLYYSAKRDNPLFPDIHNLTIKTIGLADVLKAALRSEKIQVAFVFGSLAQGTEKAASDVDLVVIGALGMRELTGLLSGVTEKIGRVINPHVLTVSDFKAKVRAGNNFITAVLKEAKIFLKGDEHELTALAR
ncbi:MAG: nucleotidyltransferase domain-containing protein [Verrucomicrobia bacterium]|nr:nucleotidyltransferase domain-containing protein [Verrucomicrobiota bacterium]MBU1910693.1 nucleotidyltransferase domain-containing protein [Verrucomicrobiota bacterium]